MLITINNTTNTITDTNTTTTNNKIISETLPDMVAGVGNVVFIINNYRTAPPTHSINKY